MNILVIITFILIALPIMYMYRAMYIFFILLTASQVLGIVHEYDFGIAGYSDINSILVLLFIVAIVTSLNYFKDFEKTLFLKPFVIIMLLGFYGIIYPYSNGSSSLFYSVKASKEYLNYLAYFAVFLFIRNQKEIDLSWKFIVWLATYYTIIELAGNISHGYVLSILQYIYRPEEKIFTVVVLPIYTVIIVMFFVSIFKFLIIKKQRIFKIFSLVFYTLGVLLTFFRVYILGATASIYILLLFKGQITKAFTSLIVILFMLSAAVLSLFLYSGKLSYSKIFDEFVGSGVTELYHYEGGSLIGRDTVTEGRRKLIKQRPWFGFGFLDKKSELGIKIKHLVGEAGAGEIGFVDKGYLDVVAKFGLIGCIIFYGAFIIIILRHLRILTEIDSLDFQAKVFASAGLIFTFLMAQFTHADLTRQFGIVPLSIIVALIEREYKLLMHKPLTTS